MVLASTSQTELRDRLLTALRSARWTTTTPVDQFQTYLSQAKRSTRISTTTPSPASEQTLVSARLTAGLDAKPLIVGRATHRLSWAGRALMEELPTNQIVHRSRPAVLMSNRLQVNELNRRVERARANRPTLDSIMLPPKLQEELVSIKKDAFMKALKIDQKHIMKYQKERERRAVLPGLKWGQLDMTDSHMISEWFNIIKEYAEDNYFSGKHFDTPLNFGGRQRESQKVEPGVSHYDLEVERTRVVQFHPALSTPFLFMPNKAEMYDRVITQALDVFDFNQHFITPLRDGGSCYGAMSEGLKGNEDSVIMLGDDANILRGGKHYAYDGVNWESQVGTIMGPAFHGTKTMFGGISHVPSGVWDTSLDGTLANMWCLSVNAEAIAAGDDIGGILEREPKDEEVAFMLGLRYVDDPDYPRLQGLKLSVDKPDASRILPAGRNVEVVSKYDEDTIMRWYLGYHGKTLDGGSLLDFLEPITAEDFRGGEIQDLIQQGELKSN